MPFDILTEVYQKADIDTEWTAGGREIEMGRFGWEVLEQWYETTLPHDLDDESSDPPGLDHSHGDHATGSDDTDSQDDMDPFFESDMGDFDDDDEDDGWEDEDEELDDGW